MCLIENLSNQLDKLINETDDISQLLYIWDELSLVKLNLKSLNEKVEMKIKNYLEERKWKRYVDKDSKLSVTIDSVPKETINTKQLKLMLSEEQYAKISTTISNEKLIIVNSKIRERLKKSVKRPKKIEQVA